MYLFKFFKITYNESICTEKYILCNFNNILTCHNKLYNHICTLNIVLFFCHCDKSNVTRCHF